MAYFPSSKDSPKTRKILTHCCSGEFFQPVNHTTYGVPPLLFPCRDTGFLEELIEAEEFTAEGAAVGGPLGFAGIEGEGGVTQQLQVEAAQCGARGAGELTRGRRADTACLTSATNQII